MRRVQCVKDTKYLYMAYFTINITFIINNTTVNGGAATIKYDIDQLKFISVANLSSNLLLNRYVHTGHLRLSFEILAHQNAVLFSLSLNPQIFCCDRKEIPRKLRV